MPIYFKSRKIKFVLVVTISLSLIVAFILSRGIDELQFVRSMRDLRYLRSENVRLNAEVLLLNSALNNVDYIIQENKKLKQMLSLIDKNNKAILPAQVVAQTPFDWERRIRIDVGSESGVGKDNLVVDHRGMLVGKVEAVGFNYSWVTLLSDSEYKSSVVCKGEHYLLAGYSASQARLEYVPYDANILEGDDVSLVKPFLSFPNIPVGKISKIIRNKDYLTLSVFVDIMADIEGVSLVFVIREENSSREIVK